MQSRFIDTKFNDAFTNMAIDEAILHYSKIPTLRVYGWNPSAISIGYNQNLEKEINIEHCKKLNISIVRRITGGKAVYHDKELTYSFILPKNLNLISNEINESYKEIANALVIALKEFGVNAEIKKVPERIKTNICFNSSNWYELIVKNKKISGSAQRRMGGKILQHGSILIDFDYQKNYLLFDTTNSINYIDTQENQRFSRPKKSDELLRILKNRITSLKKELYKHNNNYNNKTKKLNYNEISKAIKLGFKEIFNFNFFDDSLTYEEIKLAEKLKQEKYKTAEWNYKLQFPYL